MTAFAIQLNIWGMPKPGRRPGTPSDFRDKFVARTLHARKKRYSSLAAIAQDLSHAAGRRIEPDTYRKWEKDTLMPHDLIIPFCELTETDPWELLTGSPFDLGTYMASLRRKLPLD